MYNHRAFIVTVCGTKQTIDYEIIDTELSRLSPDVIITSGRSGVCRQAELWGEDHNVEVSAIATDVPDLVVVFADGTAIDDTARRARDAGISVRVVDVGKRSSNENSICTI